MKGEEVARLVERSQRMLRGSLARGEAGSSLDKDGGKDPGPKPLFLKRYAGRLSERTLHDDERARQRMRGERPLMPWERKTSDPEGRELVSRMHGVGDGLIRAGDYDKPYAPSEAFVQDSIAPSELTYQAQPWGAQDFRYPGAAFPNDERARLYGTESRYLAELNRHTFGAPMLEQAVDPLTTGPDVPTYLEQALIAMKAGGVRR